MSYVAVLDMKCGAAAGRSRCVKLDSSAVSDAMLEAQWKASRLAREMKAESLVAIGEARPALADVFPFTGVYSVMLAERRHDRLVALARFYPSDCRWHDAEECDRSLLEAMDVEDPVEVLGD